MNSKKAIMQGLDEYIEGLLEEIEELTKRICWYEEQLNQLRELYGEFGLDYPENYSIAQLTSITKAIQEAM